MKYLSVALASLVVAGPGVVLAQEVALDCAVQAVGADGASSGRGTWKLRFDPRPGYAVAQVVIDQANAFRLGDHGTDWPEGRAMRVRRTDDEVTFCAGPTPCDEMQTDSLGYTFNVGRARLDRRTGELRMVVRRGYDGVPDSETYEGVCQPAVEQPRIF
jgi:hypothetical protein